MSKFSLIPVEITKVIENVVTHENDILSIEEPLEIQVRWKDAAPKSISITMSTPGNDKALAVGFLFGEGILSKATDIISIISGDNSAEKTGLSGRVITVETAAPIDFDRLQRNFYTTSSCGVCGKASIDAVKIACPVYVSAEPIFLSKSYVLGLAEKLASFQREFSYSGGIHASALYNLQGEILAVAEDVGRHNALDKLIGQAFLDQQLPLNQHVLLLSGRASFELVQKASMAGIQVICAIGAPSSLAVELAEELNITLIGFLRQNRFNIYSAANRISL